MILETVHEEIETLVSGLDLVGFKLSYENVESVEVGANEADSLYYGDDKFVTFAVKFTDTQRLEVNPGSPNKEIGLLELTLHVPFGSGTRDIYRLIDSIDTAILLTTTPNGVYFNKRVRLGNYKIGKWAVYVYQYPFMFCS